MLALYKFFDKNDAKNFCISRFKLKKKKKIWNIFKKVVLLQSNKV